MLKALDVIFSMWGFQLKSLLIVTPIKCIAKIHYYEVSLFTILKIIKHFLCKIYKLSFTAMFGSKTMLKGLRRSFESKWVIILETRMCLINLEAIQVREMGL